MRQENDITILCRVVDNFGDAGVVSRLSQALCDLDKTLRVRIITDNINLFERLGLRENIGDRLSFFDWSDAAGSATLEFSKNCPDIILECFACGRPLWLENILFGDAAGECDTSDVLSLPVTQTVHIINVEFLTAESYAEDFHLLKSGTRRTNIKKSNFLPGFTDKTGSLIIDGIWKDRPFASNLQRTGDGIFNILLFTYSRDFSAIISAIADFQKYSGKKICVHAAQGASFLPFIADWQKMGQPFEVNELAFLPQNEWDKLLASCDFLFVRGEDSLSRACLSGVPFLWQAYQQADNYQLVKVHALLERLSRHFSKEEFAIIDEAWRAFNLPDGDSQYLRNEADMVFAMLKNSAAMQSRFSDFASSLYDNGDLASHLLAYIAKIRYN